MLSTLDKGPPSLDRLLFPRQERGIDDAEGINFILRKIVAIGNPFPGLRPLGSAQSSQPVFFRDVVFNTGSVADFGRIGFRVRIRHHFVQNFSGFFRIGHHELDAFLEELEQRPSPLLDVP